jgi:fermentation-respiration switch protein FrsA (DUF1100 family)
MSPFVQPLFPSGQEAYLTSILTLDPRAEAKAVTVPVLVVRGGGDQSISAAEEATLSAALGPAAEVLNAGPDTDRNLALPGPGHVHSNTPTEVKSNQDADAAGRVATWLQGKLRS